MTVVQVFIPILGCFPLGFILPEVHNQIFTFLLNLSHGQGSQISEPSKKQCFSVIGALKRNIFNVCHASNN
jgi:hypothetical protein